MKQTTKLLLFASITLIFSACGGKSQSKIEQPAVEETLEDEVSLEEDYMLPQPITLVHLFKDAGLSFTPGLTNPASNKTRYVKKVDQLLNLGVYSTDLAYCALNGETQSAREYLTALQLLGTKVGLEKVFSDKTIVDRFDKNLEDLDKLEELIYELQEKYDSYLEGNDLQSLAAVEFAGAWVECVYLGTTEAKKDPNKFSVAFVDQFSLLSNIVKGLEMQPTDDKRIVRIKALMNDLLTTYDGLPSVKKASDNSNFDAPVLTQDDMNQLSRRILQLRKEIITPTNK